MNRTNNLASYFPDFITDGAIFVKMNDMPWAEYIDGQALDGLYLGFHSGIKIPSQFVKLLSTNGVADAIKIASYLKALYEENWQRLWNAYIADYSPIDNYSLLETIQRDLDATTTFDKDTTFSNSGTSSGSVNETVTPDETTIKEHGHIVVTDSTEEVTHGHTVETQNADAYNVFGFNSQSEVPSDTSSGTENTVNSGKDKTDIDTTVTNSGADTEKRTGTITTSETNSNTNSNSSTGTEDSTDKKEEAETITRSRHGNTGSYSYQELIQQEFELWKENFFNQVFADCDKVLTLQVFDPCQSLV